MPTIILLLLALSLSSCAPLFQATTQDVLIDSDPAGAEVFVTGEPRGLTPLEVRLSPTAPYSLVVRKEGYAPYIQRVHPRLELARFFGFYDVFVYQHGPVHVTLRPEGR